MRKINFNQIYEGWRNQLFPPDHLKKAIESVSRSRRKICNYCEHNSNYHNTLRPDIHCVLCGCTLSAKTRCLSCECPDDPPRWKAVLTDEQEDELNEKEEENNPEEDIS